MNRNHPFRSPSGILGNVVLMFVGLLLLLKPDFGSAAIASIIGWGLIALSGIGIVICVSSWPVCGLPELILSLCGVVLGIILLIRPLALSSILGFALGVVLIFQGVRMLKTFRLLRQSGMDGYGQLALAVVTLVFAAVLMVVPLAASRLVMRLIALVMLVYGLIGLIFQIRSDRSGGPQDPNVIDADA